MGEPGSIGVLGIYVEGNSPRCQTIPSSNFTNRSWAERVLQYLNQMMPTPMTPIPLTTNNIENLMRWNQAENMIPAVPWWGKPSTQYPNRTNPLNSGQGPPNRNSLGTYANLDQAAYYLADLLLNGPRFANYGAIVAALQGNASPDTFSAAVVQSSFAETRYGVKAAIDAYNAKNPQDPIPSSAIDPTHGLNYIATKPLPPDTPAPASHGTNPSTTNGVGWDWASPQAWQPNPGTPFPGEPNMSPAPPFLSIDPTNLANYDTTTGFIQLPPPPSTGGPIGGGGPATGPAGGGSTGNTTGGTTGSTVDTTDPGTGETGSTSETGNETPPPGEQ
jgi:hypothetical protein